MSGCRTADIVISTAGRDKKRLLVAIADSGDYVMLADGRRRRAADPKRKKKRHVRTVGRVRENAAALLETGSPLTDGEIRRELSNFRKQLQEAGEPRAAN